MYQLGLIAAAIFCGTEVPAAVKSKSECIVADLFRRREQILHGIYVALQREVRFRQILCLDDSVVLIYCLCAQQMGLGKQLAREKNRIAMIISIKNKLDLECFIINSESFLPGVYSVALQ